MKRTVALGMMLLLCLLLAGCGNKDAEVNSFSSDFEKVTNDIVAKIEANPTAQGVDEALAVLDGRKADLKTKWAAIKDARGAQVSSDVQKSLEDSLKRSAEKMSGLTAKITDSDAATKLQKLITDWKDIVA
jgi:predicted component of type VI protein secretion system